ncbi:MAG: DUF6273 domain-containing protein, partial [Faecalibacterium sp.]|nr:DUF6273 domain-containing protein [Faecalibacterium sp.]
MKRQAKSILSLMLVVLMLFTSIPVVGFAANNEQAGNEITANNSIGEVLSSALEEADGGDGDESDSVNYLSSVELDGRYATVKFRTEVDGSIVVAVYDDAGSKLICSGMKEVYPEYDENDIIIAQSVDITIDTADMPETFLLKVFLLGDNNHPLCQNLEVRDYTAVYQQFLAQTTDDFEEEKVINFDEDTKNNFAVLTDGAKIVYSNNETNILESADEENGVYVFANVDDEISNLKVGDVFYYENGESAIAIKIGSISVDGDKVTLTKDDSEVSDIFDVVKIDAEAYADESSYTDEETEEVVEPAKAKARAKSSDLDVDKNKDVFVKRYEFKKWNLLSGYADIAVKAHLKIYYDIKWFGADYIDATAYTDAVVMFNVTFDGKFSKSPVIATPDIKIIPGVVSIKASIQPIFEASANFTINSKTSAKIGLECKGDVKKGGMTKRAIKELNTSETSPTLDGSFSAKVGLKISATVTAIEICHITLGAEAGVKLNGSIVHESEKNGVKHSCKNCVQGKATFYVTLSARLMFGWENTKFKWTPIDWSNDIVNYDFGQFYFSITNRAFGWGNCKYTSYLLTLIIYNNGAVAKGATVDGTTVDSSGKAANYYQSGSQSVRVGYNGQDSIYKINIGTKPMTIKFDLKTSTSDLHNEHIDSDKNGYCDACGRIIRKSDSYSNGLTDTNILNGKHTGDIIEFGEYPQSRVTDAITLSLLNSTNTEWKSYDYYIDYGNPVNFDEPMKPSDYMQYRDVKLGISWFRAVRFTRYRPYYTCNSSFSNQESNGYYVNETYWFKFEPIKWKVLDANTGLIICASIIDAQAYQNTIYYHSGEYWQSLSYSKYANNYANSSIRQWLNEDFYNIAFTVSQKNAIKLTALNNNCYYSKYNSAKTQDKIFLLSYDEANTFNSSFEVAIGSDYAKCQGLNELYGWWLRSAYDSSINACGVSRSGSTMAPYNVYYTGRGIRPACYLNVTSARNQSESVKSMSKAARLKSLFSFSKTAAFNSAIPNEDYVIVAVKDKNAKNLLDSNNLLFIDQKTADSSTIEFTYTLKEDVSDYDVLIFGKCSHSYDSEITKQPSCTETGEMTYTCSNCGESYTEEISATGHKAVTDKAIAATCTSEGKTEGSHCSVCGTVIKAQTAIAKLEHKYTATINQPDCTKEGKKVYTCSLCGDTYTEVIPPMLNHTDNNNDGKCDICGSDIGTSNPSDTCDHICHKGGFAGFIYKIIRLFWKLFGINKTCSCGVA